MATTASTKTVIRPDGRLYKPRVRRALALTNFATGSSNTYKFHTFDENAIRVWVLADGVKANSTITLTVETAPDQDVASAPESLLTSSGAASLTFTATGRSQKTFVGCNRWTQIRVSNMATGASPGASTGFFVDLEVV